MKSHKDFNKKKDRGLDKVAVKITSLHEGVRSLQGSFKEFQEDITEFMAFSAERYSRSD